MDETIPSGLKSIKSDLYIGTDNSIWQDKGTLYGWNRIARYSDFSTLVHKTGDETISGNKTLLGNTTFGTSSIFDITNTRLGIGTTSPSFMLHIEGAGALCLLKRNTSVGPNSSKIIMTRTGSTLTTDISSNYVLGGVQFRGRVAGVDADYGLLGYIANTTTVGDGSFNFYKADLLTSVLGINNSNGQITVPILTASQAVFTDGGKKLISNPITGSGSVVLSTSPTLTTAQINAPKLNTTSVVGQIWTATDTTGSGNWTTSTGFTNPMTTQNDIIYGGSSGAATRLPIGTTGKVLTSNGSSTPPSWETPLAADPNSEIISTFSGALGTIGSANITTLWIASSGTSSLTLPTAASMFNGTTFKGRSLVFKNNGTSTLTVTANGSELIDLTNSVILGPQVSLTLTSDGTKWYETSDYQLSPMTTLGDMIYGGASGTPTRLAGNTTTNKLFLTSTGAAGVATTPTYFNLFNTFNTWTSAQHIDGANLTLNQTTTGSNGSLFFGDVPSGFNIILGPSGVTRTFGSTYILRDLPNGSHGGTVAVLADIPTTKHTIFTPTTGGTVNLNNYEYNIINPVGALLALTVNLPSSPANNDTVYIKFTQSITTVTYGNGTVVDGITSPVGGGLVVLVYDSGTTSWY